MDTDRLSDYEAQNDSSDSGSTQRSKFRAVAKEDNQTKIRNHQIKRSKKRKTSTVQEIKARTVCGLGKSKTTTLS